MIKGFKNVHIKGEGLCVLEGADHPRATGDGGKILACPCPYETKDLCELADWICDEDKRTEILSFGTGIIILTELISLRKTSRNTEIGEE